MVILALAAAPAPSVLSLGLVAMLVGVVWLVVALLRGEANGSPRENSRRRAPAGRQPLSYSRSREPFHQRHRGLLIAGGLLAIIFVTTVPRLSNDAGGEADPGTTTTSVDRSVLAESACDDFTRDAGIRADDGETSLFTPNLATGDIYTVQMYYDGVRVGTCVAQATGRPAWTLVKISGP